MQLNLPQADGTIRRYTLINRTSPFAGGHSSPFNRVVYAAAHVVIDPVRTRDPWNSAPAIDWEATLAFRQHLWGLGFKVAEAMDTAQRGMGVNWPTALTLIRRSVACANVSLDADLASGAGTDQLVVTPQTTLADVIAAYEEQIHAVESAGSRVILMASRGLVALAKDGDDYQRVYGHLLRQCREKVILHWLGEMFDPALSGYWGSTNLSSAMETVLGIISENAKYIDGIKISLLDPKWEVQMRSCLPAGVKMFTGDDFNYGELIAGDGTYHSHGLLGIFDPTATVAAAALRALARGEMSEYNRIISPTVALGREIFRAPTWHYKAGVVFLAWLNGHQKHFTMVSGLESARDVVHYANVFKLADACGALTQPELAVARMRAFLDVHAGISQ